jgi:hypothetical protein
MHFLFELTKPQLSATFGSVTDFEGKSFIGIRVAFLILGDQMPAQFLEPMYVGSQVRVGLKAPILQY